MANPQNQPNQENSQKLAPGVTSDDDQNSGEVYSENLMDKAEAQVRENENASLQDDSYSFDEANTDNEEYHDVDDDDFEDFDIDNDDDFIN